MPINIPADLPARSALERERIFVMSADKAEAQDIRPLKIAIVNLMPTKIATETQLLRLLGNTPVQVDITLIRADNHISRNTDGWHLERFYTTFSAVRGQKFDGMIITGAPVEQLPFEQVDYWSDLVDIMEYSRTHVFSTMHLCWGAQAALYHHFGIPKHMLEQKKFGVFEHRINRRLTKLFRGFDDVFYCPHSRHSEIRREDVQGVADLEILAESEEAGVCILKGGKHRHFYMTGHLEYDADTLALEYFRDRDKGLDIAMPAHYFPGDDPEQTPRVTWRAHANLFFSNWLNFFVYQETPFEINSIGSDVDSDIDD
jgi:homoserine O-succinyltransferase